MKCADFALTMALEPAVIAPVLNHPSLPLDDPGGLEISDENAAAVPEERVARDGMNFPRSLRQRVNASATLVPGAAAGHSRARGAPPARPAGAASPDR